MARLKDILTISALSFVTVAGLVWLALFAVRVMNYNDCRDAEYLARYCITKELIR